MSNCRAPLITLTTTKAWWFLQRILIIIVTGGLTYLLASSHVILSCPPQIVSAAHLLLVGDEGSGIPFPIGNELSKTDETTLIDLQNVSFIINRPHCEDRSYLAVVIVTSSPHNFEKRNTIRETYGQEQNPEVLLLFHLGYSEEVQEDVIMESKQYGDIIQGNVIDAFQNMTYKHVMMFKWILYHCRNVKYVLKVEDNVFVNIPRLVDYLNTTMSPHGARRLLQCVLVEGKEAKRSWRSIWRVSPIDYPEKYYPTYCRRWAILYSVDTVFYLYREAQRSPYFWIDDVHVTGLLADKVSLVHVDMPDNVLTKSEVSRIVKQTRIYQDDFLLAMPELSAEEMRVLYLVMK